MVDAAELFGWEQVERARRYWRPLYAAAIANLALSLGLLAALAFASPGRWLYQPLQDWAWPARCVAFVAELVAIAALVRLPLGFWAGYRHEHAWGLSTQTLRSWAGDRVKALAVSLLVTVAALVGLVAAARVFPRAWPLLTAAGAAAAVLLLSWATPLLLEPLFNRFRPLQDVALAANLRKLAGAAGIPIREVLVADASRRTRKLNAYVSGLGNSRRLVLYDTLIANTSQRQTRVVVAHELGHRHAHHIVKGTLLAMGSAALFVLALWVSLRSTALLAAIHARAPGDPRIAAFVLFLASALQLLAMPLGAALSRRWERQADRHSLQLTHDPEAFESTHLQLALSNLSDLTPPRLLYLTLFSHPTATERIRLARDGPERSHDQRLPLAR